MSLQNFFAQNVQAEITEEVTISERFKDEEGKPIKWKLKTLTEEENSAIRKSATRVTRGKHGARIQETDQEEFIAKLAVASVIYPNLKNAELQASYGVMGADTLLKKMLFAGEYANLLVKVQELNGFDRDIDEMSDEVKLIKEGDPEAVYAYFALNEYNIMPWEFAALDSTNKAVLIGFIKERLDAEKKARAKK